MSDYNLFKFMLQDPVKIEVQYTCDLCPAQLTLLNIENSYNDSYIHVGVMLNRLQHTLLAHPQFSSFYSPYISAKNFSCGKIGASYHTVVVLMKQPLLRRSTGQEYLLMVTFHGKFTILLQFLSNNPVL